MRSTLCFLCFLCTLSCLLGCGSNTPPSPSVKTLVVHPYDPNKATFIVVADAVETPRINIEAERRAHKKGIDEQYKKGELTAVQYVAKSAEVDRQFPDKFTLYDDLMDPLLISALTRVKNLIVVDKHFAHISKNNRVSVPTNIKGARGPYLLRVALTEVNQEVESDERGMKLGYDFNDQEQSLGMLIAKFPLMVTGFWVTQLTNLPTEWKELEIKGVAGVDVKIIDGRNGRIVTSFPVQGTHVFKLKEIGNEYSGGFYSKQRLASTPTQAIAAALEKASLRVLEELSRSDAR